SRAYGPGSYHRAYEKGRVDYPFGYVRWTEKRNLAELVRLLASGALEVETLIAGSFPVASVQDAFTAIADGTLPGIAALIDYRAGDLAPDRRRTLAMRSGRVRAKREGELGVSVIGVGNHVLGVHLPNLKASPGVVVRALVSATGKNAAMVAGGLGAAMVSTDVRVATGDPETDAILVCSSHGEHFEQICRGLEGGKALLVEKPLVTRVEHLRELIARVAESTGALITLGLNRRYAPLVKTLRRSLPGPVDCVTYLVTPPKIPADHWTLDPVDGGGRLVAEAEHFVDLCHLLIDREPRAVTARPLGQAPDDLRQLCNFSLTIYYDGAVAHVVFDESGGSFHPREQITVLSKGQVAVLEDFKKLTLCGPKKRLSQGGLKQDMGHGEQLRQFLRAVRGEENELLEWRGVVGASACVFAAEQSLRRGGAVIDLADFLTGDPGGAEGAEPAEDAAP
ncbi:MAG: Gfo/Idh/MocA family oxidoreductase, partial [Acidobacteriota bacterium]